MTGFEEEYEEMAAALVSKAQEEDSQDEPTSIPAGYDEEFDEVVSEIDFSDFEGRSFKKNLSRMNRKIAKKKPLSKSVPVADNSKVKITSQMPRQKKLSKIIVPRSQKVVVEGVSKFILSDSPENQFLKSLGYYKGKKLQELVFIFNNNSLVDFELQLFNPSMPLDYLYSTSQNLNDKIQVAGGSVAYTDVLYNLLANPSLLVSAKIVVAGPQVTQQLSIPLQFINKAISGVQKVTPINMALQLDNMQVASDMVAFNVHDNLNRPFIPDGMDVINYTVLAGNTVTICFWYKQVSLKKVFYEEARNSKTLL